MTTLFSHFLAQALGCASTENVHNLVRTRLMFTPDHGLASQAVDEFILHGTTDEAELMFWSKTLPLDIDLLRDAASLAGRTRVQQGKRLPELQLSWVGATANLDPRRRIQVRVNVDLTNHPVPGRFDRLGPGYFERSTGYTLADLNKEGAFDQVLAFANSHWQEVEQVTGLPAERIALHLEPETTTI